MALLLNIDTATPFASVAVSRDGKTLAMVTSAEQKEHASFLQPAIESLFDQLGTDLKEIDGVSLTIGPGSYTGLRVGLSSAKGLAYALDRPLIPVVTLEVMAYAAEQVWNNLSAPEKASGGIDDPVLFCPMIDARREEVFTGIYAPGGVTVMEPRALILTQSEFEPYIKNGLLLFSGDGHLKWKAVYRENNARFLMVQHSAAHLAALADQRFQEQRFGSLAYLEPLYLKEFHKNSREKI